MIFSVNFQLKEYFAVHVSFTTACDVLEKVKHALGIAKQIPRGVDLSQYRLYDGNGRFIIDFDSLVHGDTYNFSIPNALDVISANYWTKKQLQDLR